MGVDVGPKLCAVRSILLMYQPASSSSLCGTSSPPLPLSPLLPLSTSPPFPSLLILYTSLRPSPLFQFVRSPLLRTPFSIAYGLLPCVWPLYIAHFEQYFCLQVCCPPLPSPPSIAFKTQFLSQLSVAHGLSPCARSTPLHTAYSLALHAALSLRSLLTSPDNPLVSSPLTHQPSHLTGEPSPLIQQPYPPPTSLLSSPDSLLTSHNSLLPSPNSLLPSPTSLIVTRQHN